jgi:hypothetical protein
MNVVLREPTGEDAAELGRIVFDATNGDVLRWCLSNGLRLVQPLTLMTIGEYQEPAGPYMPSILY